KDHIAVRGWPTTWGTRFINQTPSQDAGVVERIRAAGAVLVGKNTMHEMAAGITSANGNVGFVHNPWDERRVPGGSSGGSRAAVSAGLAFAALGWDGKGSVRIPAAWCGVVGMKPTPGLVSNYPSASSSPYNLLGPIARDVRDCALMLAAVAGYDPRDPISVE